jgi:EAL domain-containing protein (putative c-di-GMP-specific phosphodiesterase class I)
LPVRAIKIDRSFVNGIGHNPGDTALVTAVMAMAHNLRLKTLSVGVETAQQAGFLSHGCLALAAVVKQLLNQQEAHRVM